MHHLCDARVATEGIRQVAVVLEGTLLRESVVSSDGAGGTQ
jgi:hypothetical protein